MTFDLMQIKDEVEKRFDVEFAVKKFMGRDELSYRKGKSQVIIRIGKYTCHDERKGKEFIGFDFWNGESGLGSPCDSFEELINNLDRIKMPRKAQEQISLFE